MISDAPVGYEPQPDDPIRKAWGFVLRCIGVGLFFVLFGLGNMLYTGRWP